MTKEKLIALDGNFTWDFGSEFFIETSEGNFVWSDPDYNGDNIIREVKLSYNDWIHEAHIPFGRSKGNHIIGQYCGTNFTFKG